jgi:NADPH:quinone reductase-like Zn-dependent oxidoreductase
MEYPKTTKAILMKEYGKTQLTDVPLPSLLADQVLIKVNAAPINPSEMIFI